MQVSDQQPRFYHDISSFLVLLSKTLSSLPDALFPLSGPIRQWSCCVLPVYQFVFQVCSRNLINRAFSFLFSYPVSHFLMPSFLFQHQWNHWNLNGPVCVLPVQWYCLQHEVFCRSARLSSHDSNKKSTFLVLVHKCPFQSIRFDCLATMRQKCWLPKKNTACIKSNPKLENSFSKTGSVQNCTLSVN